VGWKAAPVLRLGRRAFSTLVLLVAVVMTAATPAWDALLMNSGVYYYIPDIAQEGGWKAFARKAYEGRNIVYLAEGLTSTVLVMDQPKHNNRYLSVNGKVEASSASDLETQLLISHIPLLLHPAPKDVMVIGLASGISVGAAAAHPVRSIRVVELEKAMVPAARLFSEWNGGALDDPRVRLSINDARNELEFSPLRYDVIVSEPSNPFMTVAANLFTEDFFRMAHRRMRPGGMFSQWVQAYCLPPEDLRSILAAFHAAFPRVLIFEMGEVDLLLVGSDEPVRFDLDAMRGRMSELNVAIDLARVGIREPLDLLPLFELGDHEMEGLIRGAAATTDDNARVEYSAPKAFDLHTTRLNYEMLEDHSASPIDYVTPPPETDEELGRLYLGIAEAWLRRKQSFMATAYAKYALDGPLDAEARALLSRIPEDPNDR
jgi:spermidine synthase